MKIYKITNLKNNKIYIGKTIKILQERFRGHIIASKQPRNYTSYLYNAFEKYGIENFKIEEIETCSSEKELDEREKFWIATLHTQDPNIGYNIQEGGEGGAVRSNEYRLTDKQLDALERGRHLKASTKLKQKLSEIRTGIEVSEETRRKISESQKGKKLKEETKQRMRESHLGMKMAERTEESKERYREGSKGRVHIHKGNENKNPKIEELDKYLNDGWELGYVYK